MQSSAASSSAAAFRLTNSGSPSTSPRTTQGGEVQSNLQFIRHQVTKLDTLAGLAIKYNVSVGDIKRANGLFSDSALYARSTILIPTGHLPIGEELQRICAQVLSGRNRDPVLHAESQSHPASAAVARIATSLNVVNGYSYPEDVPISECAWIAMCQCGGCGPMDPLGQCARNMQPVELELTDRSSEGTYLPPASVGPTRQQDVVRRRRNQADDADSDSANSVDWGLLQRLPHYTAKPPSKTSDSSLIGAWLTELGKAIGEGVSNTVAKVKEAANQPVLAMSRTGSSGTFASAAADAVLASRRKASGALLGRAPFEGGSGSGGSYSSSAVAQASPVASRTKQGGKLD